METTIRTQGKSYDAGDVIITLLGNVSNEVSEIVYDEKTAHQNNYYLGSRKPKGWSEGTTEFTGSMTVSMKEQIAIENSIKDGEKRLVRIKPFQIIVQYVDEYNTIVTDTITAKFTGQGRKMSIGSQGEGMQLELHVLDIKWNTAA